MPAPVRILVLAAALASVAQADQTVRLSAAASAVDAADALARAFEATRPDVDVSVNAASSGALARQIAAGAPVDVFLTADPAWMTAAVDAGRINHAAVVDLWTNRLVVIHAADQPTRTLDAILAALRADARLMIADPDVAPVGQRALEALNALDADPPAHAVVRTLDARAVVHAVATGAAAYGIVYATDARLPGVAVAATLPPDAHQPIRYQIAPIATAPNIANDFIVFVTSNAGGDVARAHGFEFAVGAAAPPAPPVATDVDIWTPLRLSLLIALASTTMFAVPGVLIAWLLARRRFPGKILVETMVHLPLVLPPVVVGYLLLAGLSRLGAGITFTWFAAALAGGVMGFPLLVRAARLGFEQADRRLEQAASTLGASPWRVWRTITLPLAAPGVAAGLFLAAARAFGEFGATIVVAGNIPGETRTLPLAIFSAAHSPGADAAALTLIIVSVVVACGALAASAWLGRRMERRRDQGSTP